MGRMFSQEGMEGGLCPIGSTNTCIHPAEGCALCVPLELCMELTVGSDMAEKLWAWIKGQGSNVPS